MRVRTNIEAFQAMFGEITGQFGEWIMEDFRDTMKACKSAAIVLKDEEIPKNIPKSHWWWFYESRCSEAEWREYFCKHAREE